MDGVVIDVKPVYNYDFKMNLKLRIEKIRNKINLIKIFMLIRVDKNNEYLVNNNGIFIEIHDLSNNTYKILDKFINSIS